METAGRVRILVADGRDAVRDGLMRLLAAEADFDVVASVASAGAVLPAIRPRAIDVAVLAEDLPGGADALIALLGGVWPDARTIVLSAASAACHAGETLTASRSTVLSVDAGIAVLAAAIRRLSSVEQAQQPAFEAARAPGGAPILTARERELLLMIAAGSSNARIAALTGLSPHTVRAHLRSIARKLGVRNRAHAVTAALQSGQIVLDRAS